MAHLRRRRFASEAVDDDVLDRVRPRRRDVRRVDPESPRHTRTGDETSLLNDRVRPRGIRGVKKKLTPGALLKLLQCHNRNFSNPEEIWLGDLGLRQAVRDSRRE